MIEVNWEATLPDGTIRRDSVENGSWRFFNDNISKLRILSQIGEGRIDDNKHGYYISNKVICVAGKDSIELVGIGYWTKDDTHVRIKWYDKTDMQLRSVEAKPLDQCEGSLKINR